MPHRRLARKALQLVRQNPVAYAVLIVMLSCIASSLIAILYAQQADRRVCPLLQFIDAPLTSEQQSKLTNQQIEFRKRLHAYREQVC